MWLKRLDLCWSHMLYLGASIHRLCSFLAQSNTEKESRHQSQPLHIFTHILIRGSHSFSTNTLPPIRRPPACPPVLHLFSFLLLLFLSSPSPLDNFPSVDLFSYFTIIFPLCYLLLTLSPPFCSPSSHTHQ